MKESLLFQNIVEELRQIPDSYWNGIYELLHNIRENSVQTQKKENQDFDWDNLVNDVHTHRQNNNERMAVISNLI